MSVKPRPSGVDVDQEISMIIPRCISYETNPGCFIVGTPDNKVAEISHPDGMFLTGFACSDA
jgi:hypothetical protein